VGVACPGVSYYKDSEANPATRRAVDMKDRIIDVNNGSAVVRRGGQAQRKLDNI